MAEEHLVGSLYGNTEKVRCRVSLASSNGRLVIYDTSPCFCGWKGTVLVGAQQIEAWGFSSCLSVALQHFCTLLSLSAHWTFPGASQMQNSLKAPEKGVRKDRQHHATVRQKLLPSTLLLVPCALVSMTEENLETQTLIPHCPSLGLGKAT